MNGCIRLVSEELHPFEIAFFRNLFGLAFLLPLVARVWRTALRTSRFKLHALRGLLNTAAMLSFFLAVSMTPLATVAALSFTSPLFATLLAPFVLKEKVGRRRLLGVGVGFIGALIILQPGIEAMSLGALLVLLSSSAWAAALLDIKLLSRTESSLTITLYASLFLTPITFVAALPYWLTPSLESLGWLMLIGALGSLTQLSVANAMRTAEATQVLPGDFTKLVWAALIGYMFFGEVPHLATLLGAGLICGSVAFVAYRETQAKPHA
jgi:drug/metabolite transporter (DMT)-like permease